MNRIYGLTMVSGAGSGRGAGSVVENKICLRILKSEIELDER